MAENYRVKYKVGDLEIEVESTDKAFVENKLNELIKEPSAPKPKTVKKTTARKSASTTPKASSETDNDESGVDTMTIVNAINGSDNHDLIDQKILKKSNQLNRILMVFHFVNKEYDNNTSITTGDIERITDQLGVRIRQPNAATKIKGNSKYFSAGSVRKKGAVVKYKINRKGLEEYERIISS